MPATATALAPSVLVSGDAINAAIGHQHAVPASPESCYKLTTHKTWGSASQTDYTYQLLWDATREVVFAVLIDLYTCNFHCTGKVENAFEGCPDADASMWAQVEKQVREAKATRSRQDQEIRNYIESLRPKQGLRVVAVKGRKMAKGSKGTIERVLDGAFGRCAMIDGQWIALGNLLPDVAAPEGAHLSYYYENRERYFIGAL